MHNTLKFQSLLNKQKPQVTLKHTLYKVSPKKFSSEIVGFALTTI